MYRCDRPRKRSKRRAIFCPIHECHLDSVSRKYPLFADQVEQLRKLGIGQLRAKLLLNSRTAIPLSGEWLESFWCAECQSKDWYWVKLQDARYQVQLAPQALWQYAVGVHHPHGNPSVGEFTLNAARGYGRG